MHVAHLLALERIENEMTQSVARPSAGTYGHDSVPYTLTSVRNCLRGESQLATRRKPDAVFILGGAERICNLYLRLYIHYYRLECCV